MTGDALEYLRAANPAPHGSTAPPVQWVLARIETAGAPPRRRRPPFVVHALVPVVAVAAALTVVAVVVLLAVIHRPQAPPRRAPATTPTSSIPSPSSLMPRGGMHGTVLIDGAGSPSAGDALVYFDQCRPCHAGGNGGGPAHHTWTATTADGGTTWHVARASRNLTMFAFAGGDAWAEGIGADRASRFFTSHDGGQTWQVASSAAPAPGGAGDVSIAGGEVWSLGNGCARARCTDTILRAAASGDHLAAAKAQPPLGGATNVSVMAAGRDTAYVLSNGTGPSPRTQLFATEDGGRTWQSIATPCAHRAFGRLYGSGAGALWALCSPTHGPTALRRSADNGRSWVTQRASFSGYQLQVASTQVAWAVGAGGRVLRTSDGGRSWVQVWYGGRPAPSVLAGSTPAGLNRSWTTIVTVQSQATATVIVQVTRGHGEAVRTNFVTYRTTDGGRTWHPSVVRLPSG